MTSRLPIVEATITRRGIAPLRRPIRARERHVSKVFVLDTQKRPLGPVHPGHARLLLKEGKTATIFTRAC